MSSASSSASSSAAVGLLPKHHTDFRSKEYWDSFFTKRGDVAFEWYGSYSEVSPTTSRYVKKADRILVVGCGNSEFSSSMYDDGYFDIVNLDFSELVIAEMKAKHATSRPRMRWNEGDMTDMKAYADGQFDVVLDKGALDALMSVNSEEVRSKALSMFKEVTRVLSSSGKYICISLCESYIFEELLTFFCKDFDHFGWFLSVETFDTVKQAPFIPFVLVLSKIESVTSPLRNIIRMSIDNLGMKAAKAKPFRSKDELLESVSQIQNYKSKRFDIKDVRVGRFESIDFYTSNPSDTTPRFTLLVIDIAPDKSELPTRHTCAVLLIPSGRENEYQFYTQDGLESLAHQASTYRLIAVRTNRPHRSVPMEELQTILSPIILSLQPSITPLHEKIPYMAVAEDSKWNVIYQGSTAMSGEIVIEETDDVKRPNAVVRRLIFLQNQSLVQTEVRLIKRSPKASSSTSKKKGSDKSKGKNVSRTGTFTGDDDEVKCTYTFDDSYIDSHHCAAIAAAVLNPDLVHRYTIPLSSSSDSGGGALVIGLGGGAFCQALNRYLPSIPLVVCEIDSDLIELSQRFFGCTVLSKTEARQEGSKEDSKENEENSAVAVSFRAHSGHRSGRNSVFGCDGLQFITDYAAEIKSCATSSISNSGEVEKRKLFEYIFIDADSKDLSVGLSAPPLPFITEDSLQAMFDILSPDNGILVLNVVARDKNQLTNLISKVAAVFNPDTSHSCGSSGSDDSNSSSSARGGGGGGKSIDMLGSVDSVLEFKNMFRSLVQSSSEQDNTSSANSSLNTSSSSSSSSSSISSSSRRNIFLLRPSEDNVNVALLAVKSNLSSSSSLSNVTETLQNSGNNTGSGKAGKKKPKAVEKTNPHRELATYWLKTIDQSEDILEILDLVSNIKPA